MKFPLFRSLLLSSFLLFTASCSSSSSDNEILLRIIHLLPGVGLVNLDVEEDDPLGANDRISFDNVGYLESTGYFRFDDEIDLTTFKVERASDGVRVIDQTEVLDGTRFTAYVGGTAGDPFIFVSKDSYTPPGGGSALLRVVHGAPNAPAVDVYVGQAGVEELGAEPTISSLDYTDNSGYLEVQEGSYRVRVTLAGTTDVVIDSGTVVLGSRDVVTAIATEAESGGAPFGVILVTDQ